MYYAVNCRATPPDRHDTCDMIVSSPPTCLPVGFDSLLLDCGLVRTPSIYPPPPPPADPPHSLRFRTSRADAGVVSQQGTSSLQGEQFICAQPYFCPVGICMQSRLVVSNSFACSHGADVEGLVSSFLTRLIKSCCRVRGQVPSRTLLVLLRVLIVFDVVCALPCHAHFTP